MEYNLSLAELQQGKMFDSKNKFTHNTGNRLKLFPFTTGTNTDPVKNLSGLIGTFLCKIEKTTPTEITVEQLVKNLKDKVKIEASNKEIGDKRFSETVEEIFFCNKNELRPLNLEMLLHIPYKELSEEKIASFLVDVFEDNGNLKNILIDAKKREKDSFNVFESFVLSCLPDNKELIVNNAPYYRVVNSLIQVFSSDFDYILKCRSRVRKYLETLLEVYFFSYIAQTCLQLDRFLMGERDKNIPLYFCVEWEKTSQNRKCFEYGWRILQSAVEKMFAHAVTLEILNHTEEGQAGFDYIALRDYIERKPERMNDVAKDISVVSTLYRESIEDCDWTSLQDKECNDNPVFAEIDYLYRSIKYQFENTKRLRAYNSYADKYKSFCLKFLKQRGRSGYLLNLSEEVLIFLTKVSIKDKERMRLKDVFDEFEKRGIFLDDISKKQVTYFYEKLNLIEKKSDSGDAKYVKRIL